MPIPEYTGDAREDWKLFWIYNFLAARANDRGDHQHNNYVDAREKGLRQRWHVLPNGEEFLAFQLPPHMGAPQP